MPVNTSKTSRSRLQLDAGSLLHLWEDSVASAWCYCGHHREWVQLEGISNSFFVDCGRAPTHVESRLPSRLQATLYPLCINDVLVELRLEIEGERQKGRDVSATKSNCPHDSKKANTRT